MKYTWDPKKAAANNAKHKVSFEEAVSCFDDEHGKFFADRTDTYEDRLILLAFSAERRVLLIVHAEVEAELIRIISARKPSKKEGRLYDTLD